MILLCRSNYCIVKISCPVSHTLAIKGAGCSPLAKAGQNVTVDWFGNCWSYQYKEQFSQRMWFLLSASRNVKQETHILTNLSSLTQSTTEHGVPYVKMVISGCSEQRESQPHFKLYFKNLGYFLAGQWYSMGWVNVLFA